MKQETQETISQNTTQEKNSEIKVLNIDHFYKLFLREKRKYNPSLFCINKETKKKRKEGVSFILFKKIVSNYLKIYFFDFYMRQTSLYFFLGGFMKKVQYKKWKHKMKKGYDPIPVMREIDASIGLFWYLRPTPKMFYMVKIKKMKGKRNQIPKIEKIYSQNFDKDLLPIFGQEAKKGRKHKTLYLCTQT